MRSRARSVLAAPLRGIAGLAIGLLLLAAAPLGAQETPAPATPADFAHAQARTLGYEDERLRPPAGFTGADGQRVEAKPILSARGMVIGAAVGCVVGAWRFATASGQSGRIAVGHGVAGCLVLSLPGMLLGGIWIP